MSKSLKITNGNSGGSGPPPYYRAPAPARVDLEDEESVIKWSGILGLSKQELLSAIHEFGPIVRDIRKGLLQKLDEAA